MHCSPSSPPQLKCDKRHIQSWDSSKHCTTHTGFLALKHHLSPIFRSKQNSVFNLTASNPNPRVQGLH